MKFSINDIRTTNHNTRSLLTAVVLFYLLSACQVGDSKYMSENQRKRLESAYKSLQADYEKLMTARVAGGDSLSTDLQSLYLQMDKMRRKMEVNHHQMIRRNMDRKMQKKRMMPKGMGMHMQSHMTGEWYRQMISLHRQMSDIHKHRGEKSLYELNHRLTGIYKRMLQMIPGLDEPSEVPYNKKGDPDLLNGKYLYSQNCAGCHGNNGKGIAGVFPPLLNTRWVTGSRETPMRILLHGLRGEIKVSGQRYSGVMPSFKARLSTAEIASILNYLRRESDGDFSKITQQDVIGVAKTNSERTSPWQAEELHVE